MAVSPWRATCVQMRSDLAIRGADRTAAWSIIRANLARAIGLIEAACDGPEPPALVVLPEFAFQGPPHGLPHAAWIERACCTVPGPITEPLQALARRRGIHIAAHQFEIDPEWPGRYFNTSFLVSPAGTVILRYRRINCAAFPSPHDFMDAWVARYRPDEIFPVVTTPLGRLCMIACGEINVPEVARVMMMQGAEVILHPTNSPRRPAQEAAKIVRAAENMMYVVSANVAEGIGFSLDGSVKGGRSHILDHLGRTLAYRDDADENTAVSALVDIEALRADRRRDTGTANPLIRARWEMYRPFFANASFYPPNSFLDAPMPAAAAAQPFVAASLAAMTKAGVLTEADDHR